MTQEEKQLLFKDICARLPYGVICNLYDTEDANKKFQLKELSNLIISAVNSECIRPYLRPMSSMTEEEKEWLYSNFDYIESFGVKCYDKIPEYYDWLNEHHFDYRGLIEKGLAVVAPEGMYKEK